MAKILGQRQGRTVVSTDAEIVKEAGQTIPEIVEQFGWGSFSKIRNPTMPELKDETDLVIDTGGGLILKEDNVKMLKGNGTLFWLTAEVPTIASRIGGDTQRHPFPEQKPSSRNRRDSERTNA